jgi:DNA-binding transcriptional regulator YdaS (Cro superfamily)
MILRDWLRKEGLLPYQFAKLAGFAPATIYKSVSGDQRLSARLAVIVEDLTDGEVTRTEAVWPEDFIEIDENGNEQLLSVPKKADKK